MFWAQLEAGDGRSAAAVEQYREALAIDGKNMAAPNNLACLLADGNRVDEALPLAAPDSPAEKGMYTLAASYLESASQEGSASRKYHLAMAYLKAGDPKRGLQVLKVAMKMDPTLPVADATRPLFGNGVKQ